MSTATIQIPVEHIGPLRESLEASRRDLVHQLDGDGTTSRIREIDELLAQLATSHADSRRSVSGARELLWQAAYDALCTLAEGFAADCNELWRGRPTIADARVALDRIEGHLDLLDSLGAPSGDPV